MVTKYTTKILLQKNFKLHLFECHPQLFALIIVSICFGWKDKGVKYSDLNSGDYDQGGNIVFFMMIGMVSLLFLLCVIIYSMLWIPRVFSPCLVGFSFIFNYTISLLNKQYSHEISLKKIAHKKPTNIQFHCLLHLHPAQFTQC